MACAGDATRELADSKTQRRIETEVNEQTVLVNSIGARGKEVGTRKAPNSRRIVFLGDNATFGQGVELADTFAFDAVKSLGGSRVGLEAVVLAAPIWMANACGRQRPPVQSYTRAGTQGARRLIQIVLAFFHCVFESAP